MGIGYPLLHLLDCVELHAVLAHEFGHLTGSDTRLGMFVSSTRLLMLRTVHAGRDNLAGAILSRYATRYLRWTAGVAREQEQQADAIAVEVSSPAALASALVRLEGGDRLHKAFLSRALLPMVRAGRRPAWRDGFTSFLVARGGDGAVIEAAALPRAAGPFDSHPPLGERLAGLGVANGDPAIVGRLGARPALTLLGPANEEAALVEALTGVPTASLRPMDWSEYSAVSLEGWANTLPVGLAGLRLSDLPVDEAGWRSLCEQCLHTRTVEVSTAAWQGVVVTEVGRALTLALHHHGYDADVTPIGPTVAVRGDDRVEPFELVRGLVDGTIPASTLREGLVARGLDTARIEGAAGPRHSSRSTAMTPTPTPHPLAPTPVAPDGPRTQLGRWECGGLAHKRDVWCDDAVIGHDKRTLRWDEITSITIKVTSSMGGDLSHEVTLATPKTKVSMKNDATRVSRRDENARDFDLVVDRFACFAQRRIQNGYLERLRAGEKVKVGGATLSRDGWKPPEEVRRSLIPWSLPVTIGFRHGDVLYFTATKGEVMKQKYDSKINRPNALLLPALFEACRAEFGSAPGTEPVTTSSHAYGVK